MLIKIFTQTIAWDTIYKRYGPVLGKNSFDAEIASCCGQ